MSYREDTAGEVGTWLGLGLVVVVCIEVVEVVNLVDVGVAVRAVSGTVSLPIINPQFAFTNKCEKGSYKK